MIWLHHVSLLDLVRKLKGSFLFNLVEHVVEILVVNPQLELILTSLTYLDEMSANIELVLEHTLGNLVHKSSVPEKPFLSREHRVLKFKLVPDVVKLHVPASSGFRSTQYQPQDMQLTF